MRIRWYGHAAFGLTTGNGVRMIIDPYEPGGAGGAIGHAPITDHADIVLVSHDHGDHNGTSTIKGPFTEVRTGGSYDVKGVKVLALPAYHDASQGKERGENIMFVIEADGLRVVHTGDLGHLLDREALDRIGRADVLMLPVGGTFTITAAEAGKVVDAIKPSVILPMHYKTEKVALPLTPVEDFTKGKERVRKVDASEIEVAPGSLPDEPEIVLLRYAN
jgi:L-ascorbate metabolism protein UlaG (beta-lactamase superfamily)